MGFSDRNDRGAYHQAESVRVLSSITRRDRGLPADEEWEEPPTGPVSHGRHASYSRPQTVTISVPALRTVLALAAVVAISVVLSVVATVALISVMNAGVILPQYSRYDQPAQVNQLGVCVGKGRIWTPQNVGFCRNGKFVHVQPNVSAP